MKIELKRQMLHLLFGGFFISLALLLGRVQALQFALALFAFGSALSFLILRGFSFPAVSKVLRDVRRQHEDGRLPGISAMYFVMGIILALSLFPPRAALAGLVVLTFGDTASTLAGTALGRHRIFGGRTVEGTLGGIFASFLVLLFLTSPAKALLVAVAGMLAEHLPVNDSYSIPAAAGLAMVLLG